MKAKRVRVLLAKTKQKTPASTQVEMRLLVPQRGEGKPCSGKNERKDMEDKARSRGESYASRPPSHKRG